jgi:hypothetical protein
LFQWIVEKQIRLFSHNGRIHINPGDNDDPARQRESGLTAGKGLADGILVFLLNPAFSATEGCRYPGALERPSLSIRKLNNNFTRGLQLP